jgi:hypothetical protein
VSLTSPELFSSSAYVIDEHNEENVNNIEINTTVTQKYLELSMFIT